MAKKRYTDADKWKREWFCQLPMKAKLVWQYLLDQCDHSGVWHRNFKLMSQQVGFKVSEPDFEKWFGAKVIFFDGDKYFIPSYIRFQYGELNPANNAHKQPIEVVRYLSKILPNLGPLQDLLRGAQDKDKEKEDSSLESAENLSSQLPLLDLAQVYEAYPRKGGMKEGVDLLREEVTSPEVFNEVMRAVRAFANEQKALNTDRKFIPTFKNWVKDWRAWVPAVKPRAPDPPPKSEDVSTDEGGRVGSALAAKFIRQLEGGLNASVTAGDSKSVP